MTGKPRGLPLDDVERLRRWEQLVAARNAEITRLREAAAEAIVALRYGRADVGEVARLLHEQTHQPAVTFR